MTGLLAALALIGTQAQPPGLRVTAFVGDVADQKFVTLTGKLAATRTRGATTEWSRGLATEQGRPVAVAFEATSVTAGEHTAWRYQVTNREPELTVCGVTFPALEPVRIGTSWEGNRVVWPSLYRGALVTDLGSQEGFEKQARSACKGVPFLRGLYQGDLCLPFFVHEGPGESAGMMVLDPTHEVVELTGRRGEAGISYALSTHPNVPTGKSWRFGEVEVFRSSRKDWHAAADRYRQWLTARGFGPALARHREVATLSYGRWDGLHPSEAITWAKALGIRDVLLWVVLYGRGDQYYPCYFPGELTGGIEGTRPALAELRQAGLNPYFYTNGYLLSPLQTKADVEEWQRRAPKEYPEYVARGDTGYAQTTARFRAAGHDFAGDWLQTPGGILPLRVRRVSFQWGEYPVYWWHLRPFWAACVGTPEWRKLFRDTARLHAQLGARGIFIDQVGAIHPEICAARGHGHDGESFGLWNRAYLQLLREVKDAGGPGFFIEVEGAADVYGRTVDRCLGGFQPVWPEGVEFPKLLRYTAPWILTDLGMPDLRDAGTMARWVEEMLLLGCTFRVGTGPKPDDMTPLQGEGARLLKAGIASRRELSPYIDQGRFMDRVGLTGSAPQAAWFQSHAGILIVGCADPEDGGLTVEPAGKVSAKAAYTLDWRTGAKAPARVSAAGGRVTVAGLVKGFHLVVIPRTTGRQLTSPRSGVPPK